MESDIKEPLKLPCGLVLPNRLVKAAMAEGMAEKSHLPGTRISCVYGEWAKGGWGALLTGMKIVFESVLALNLMMWEGNIQVDVRHLGGYGDLATREYQEDEWQSFYAWKQYADTCQQHGTPAVAQICHPGRQSPRGAGERGFFGKAIAPSEIPLDIGNGWVAAIVKNMVFGVPKAMSRSDIGRVIAQFSNIRQDEYGPSAEGRARIVLEIIHQIRRAVPATFCVGIKLNSADHDTSEFEETMTQIRFFSEAGVDFLEISGGSYEDPTMMGRGLRDETSNVKSEDTEHREAFFLDFATQTRKRFPNLVLLLTGGFRTRKGIEAALKGGVCDIVGIGRPAVLNLDFPLLMMDDIYSDQEARVVFSKVPIPFLARLLKIRMLGGGAETQYFRGQIHRIAAGLVPHAP
ncbi:unnamed protein product [Penicillium egyptiacum]|uniref:NADH:flavin oxidoreductase/NADH oxidase N-terminal domain-containing protein n=1 Tax=Penicillium egyptiacum TaxID=1303716 RepID=A0A9W4NY40_9EURO|nr:unnamed protein product [Penicillium egyptiacum]